MHSAYSASSYSPHRALRAMVGMAGQNGRGPVNLFKKHDANHLMRPGRRAERNAQFSLALQIGRKSVRASDHENCVGDPSSRHWPSCRAKAALSMLLPRSSSATSTDFLRYRRRNRRGFLRYPGRGVARAAFPKFHESRGRESRACGRCPRSARDSARPVPAPGPASAGRLRPRQGA